MRVDGVWYRTIWLQDEGTVRIIDQRALPHAFVVEDLQTTADMVAAIRDMHLRGAGLIGCAAAYGMYLAAREADLLHEREKALAFLRKAGEALVATRPTAVNLQVGVQRVLKAVESAEDFVAAAREEAAKVTDEDAESCKAIGEAGAALLKAIFEKKKAKVNVLTHCNAGWLAFADWGSALSPVYAAHDAGVPLHVYVDETRPRNQGAALTAWELGRHGVEHTVIADNAGGHLMQRGMVDIVIVGADRVTRGGDVCNKIGTYLKALAAKESNIPFYAALPSSTLDWQLEQGSEIPIEERNGDEVRCIEGFCEEDGKVRKVRLTPEGSPAGNWAFDVTPRHLVTGILTERGLSEASEKALLEKFPERA